MSEPSGSSPTHRSAAELNAPSTQLAPTRADYLGEDQREIGKRIADDRLELFVSCDPAPALQQHFATFAPDYIALHDISARMSLRLLNSIAAALSGKLQELTIRRQGHGIALATLRFVEMPSPGRSKLRIYSTDIDADTQSRRQVASVLLGHSRLGVLMIGELPAHTLDGELRPLRDAIARGPWPNRNLLLLPMGTNTALASHASALAGRSGLNVRVTPTAASANDAWSYVTGAWNLLRSSGDLSSAARPAAARSAPPGASPAQPAGAAALTSTAPMPLDPPDGLAGGAAASTPPAPVDPRWARYAQQCGSLKGMISCCVFDLRTQRALAHAGARPGPEQLVAQGTALAQAMSRASQALGLGHAQPDAAITLAGHHLVLHPLPGCPGIVLHLVLDASIANLTLARMQLVRLEASVLGSDTV